MKYLDANVFVSALHGDVNAQQVVIGMATHAIETCTSCLTWDEVVWVLRKDLPPQRASDESRKFLGLPHLILLDVTALTIEQADEIIHRYRIKPRDAIHAASALQHGIHEIVSDDADFDKVHELKRISTIKAAALL